MLSPLLNTTACMTQSVGVVNALVTTLLQALVAGQCKLSSPQTTSRDYGDVVIQHGLKQSYDFVIVGAGSAGSVLASRLSENPNRRVLVLEAGGDAPQEAEVPGFFFTTHNDNRYTWNYQTEQNNRTCLALRNRTCHWPAGKSIGGTSAINGMAYVRSNHKDHEDWERLGNNEWNWSEVWPFYERSVQPVGNKSYVRGYLPVNSFELHHKRMQRIIYDAAGELGLRRVSMFGEGPRVGYDNVMGTIASGRRMSTGKAHLARVNPYRPNLHVIKHAVVKRLNFNATNNTVMSVSFLLRNRKEFRVNITKELILSAGAVGSPKLLMLSGVGPRQHLQSIGIKPVHNLPIGEHLQDHVMLMTFFKFNEGRAKPVQRIQQLDNFYEYLMHARGPYAAHGTLSLIGFSSSQTPASVYPDTEYYHLFFRRGENVHTVLNNFALQSRYVRHLQNITRTADVLLIIVNVMYPKSTGNLRLRSRDFRDAPKITPRYLRHTDDVQTMLHGIKHLMRMERTSAFARESAEIIRMPLDECNQLEFRSDAYWLCYMKYFAISGFHYSSTVKMGPKRGRETCLNQRFQLFGVRNLRVIDGSVTPQIFGANPHAGIVMMAERGAEFIANDWRNRTL